MDKKIIDIARIKEDIANNSNEDLNKKSNFKSQLVEFFNKKNIKIFVLGIIGLFAFILFMGIGRNKEEESINETTSTYITTLQYCEALEKKLENVLSEISGAGQVSVMISVDGSPELIYATNSDNKTSSTSSGSTVTSTSNPIIVESNGNYSPLILTENLPEVKGVIVVSSGAHDISIKLDILEAVSTLMNISTEKISVLKGI